MTNISKETLKQVQGDKKNNKIQSGYSTLEILIAFAILIMSLSAIIAVSFGSQTVAVDSQTNDEALYKAQKQLEDARALSRENFLAVDTTNYDYDNGYYSGSTTVTDISQCLKKVVTRLGWNVESRPQFVELSTILSSVSAFFDLGNDCDTDIPDDEWECPAELGSVDFTPGGIQPTAIDVIDKLIYMIAETSPGLFVVDATTPEFPSNIIFSNGYDGGNGFRDIDVARFPDGKTYAFFANNSYILKGCGKDDKYTNQFQIVDVSDSSNPILVATKDLLDVNLCGSYPGGNRIFYFKNFVYITTRETAGHEFHIFDVTEPDNPREKGSAIFNDVTGDEEDLNHTVNNLVVREQKIADELYRFAYLATTGNPEELMILDVTDPQKIINISKSAIDFIGKQDAVSVYAIGNKLYLGKKSSPGPDFFIYDISNPYTGLILKGSQDIGTDVRDIDIVSRYAFLATSKEQYEFQVWDVKDPKEIKLISRYNFPNIVNGGIDYESGLVYVASQAEDALKIIYSPENCGK